MRRFQCSLSDIVSSILSKYVDALVSQYVLSGISDAQRRESEFLRELIALRDSLLCLPSVFCQSVIASIIEHVCMS